MPLLVATQWENRFMCSPSVMTIISDFVQTKKKLLIQQNKADLILVHWVSLMRAKNNLVYVNQSSL